MNDIYTKNVMDHFMDPRNVGVLENADAVGEVGNAKCGDIMRMYLKIDDNRITDIKFKTFGCGAAIATSSMATEMVKGMTIEEALKVTNRDVINALGGLPDAKIHCSVLAEEAIREAINNYRKERNLPGADSESVCSGCCKSCGADEIEGRHG